MVTFRKQRHTLQDLVWHVLTFDYPLDTGFGPSVVQLMIDAGSNLIVV